MKHKKHKHQQQQQQVQQAGQKKPLGISAIGKKIIIAGIIVLAAGYFILTKTDPAGQNLASKISPFLILGGYALIGIGIAVPEKKNQADQEQQANA
ncbi:MAG: hypothetical protein ABII64_02025 [Elusimicrobiota bacterium]